MRVFLFFFFSLFCLSNLVAQNTNTGNIRKHFIYFKDKANTPYSTTDPGRFLSARALERRQKQGIALTNRDLPVNPNNVKTLNARGASVLYTSKWLNAAVVNCDSVVLRQLLQLPFVKSGQTLSRKITNQNNKAPGAPKQTLNNPALRTTNDRAIYGKAYNQANMIGAIDLHTAGFRGENMNVAIFDGGFPGVDGINAFSHLFSDNRIKGTYDFVGKDSYVFERDNHGTNVLSTMAAYEPGTIVGTAYRANYFLFITEDSGSEHHIEEVNWLLAAEYADSAGVDVINSSLGYNDFEAPSVDYTYEDMNGRNAIITKAADIAASTGMLVVNSAGNEGNKPWRYISAPADGDSVLTVGAVDSLGRLASFSSVGPTFDGRIKPNLVAQGVYATILSRSGVLGRANGTSFSSPILAGMVACFWQSNPQLTNMDVIRLLQASASKADNPDNLFGYGIPNGYKAYEVSLEEINKTKLFPNPVPKSGKLNLRLGREFLNQKLTVTIHNLIAQRFLTQTFQSRSQTDFLILDVAALHPGLYACTVLGSNKQESFKFIKL